MKKQISFICALLLSFFIAGTGNASYLREDLKSEYEPGKVDFYKVTSSSVDFGLGGGKPIIDFIFPDHFGRVEQSGDYGRFFRRWTQKDRPMWYKDYFESDYGKRRIIKRILFEEKGIDIGDNVTIPRGGHRIRESAVPIGSSAMLLGSGVLGLLLVAARRLRFRD